MLFTELFSQLSFNNLFVELLVSDNQLTADDSITLLTADDGLTVLTYA